MDFFDKYTHNYDLNNISLKYKYYHSIRVMVNMEKIAKGLKLSEADVTLAKCIGILHDIGRFEQYTRNQNFDDFVFDHGDYGEQVLRDNNALSNYNIAKGDYEVVYKAIRNHNKYMIEQDLNERELLFTKMIRDADKIDILYAFGNGRLKEILVEDDSPISETVKASFFDNQVIKRKPTDTISENIVLLFALAYDLNYDFSKKIVKEQKLYDKIYREITNKEKFAPYIEHINNYLEEK